MRLLTLPALTAAAATLAACTEPPVAEAVPLSRIETAAAFDEAIVGKRLSIGDDYVVISDDGTFAGNFGGNDIAGTWVWSDDGYWCRTITQGSQRPEDCQLIEATPDVMRGTRDRGEGSSFIYEIGL
ncbi:MAG: hypothetical protein AAFQ51_13125 [Pseudomonadota bacterium]